MNEKKPLAARLAPQNVRLGDLVIEAGMIRFSCPSCGKRLKAPVVKPGAKTRCPKCNQTVDVPSSQRTTAPLAGNSSFSANEAEPPPLPGETKWYYSVNDQKHGPITKRELSELLNLARIAPSSLVWREGYAEWLPANTVKELIPNGNNSPINDGTNPMSISPIRNKRIRTWICFAVIFAGFCFVGWRITRSIEAEDNKWVNKVVGNRQGERNAAEQVQRKQSNGGTKIELWRSVLKKYRQLPGPLDGAAARERANNELESLQNEFLNTPYDPIKNRDECKKIIAEFKTEMEGKYKGFLYNMLYSHIHIMVEELYNN